MTHHNDAPPILLILLFPHFNTHLLLLLLLPGHYYTDVLHNPEGTDHGNIRALMATGWTAVEFPEGLSLSPKPQ